MSNTKKYSTYYEYFAPLRKTEKGLQFKNIDVPEEELQNMYTFLVRHVLEMHVKIVGTYDYAVSDGEVFFLAKQHSERYTKQQLLGINRLCRLIARAGGRKWKPFLKYRDVMTTSIETLHLVAMNAHKNNCRP